MRQTKYGFYGALIDDKIPSSSLPPMQNQQHFKNEDDPTELKMCLVILFLSRTDKYNNQL